MRCNEDRKPQEVWTREMFQEYGRRGGKIGGPARAARLTPEERSRIAAKGAAARWAKRREPGAGPE